jgi:hypothetical protein
MPSESLPFGSLSAHDEDELAHARKLTSIRLKECLARADEFEQRLQYFEAQRRANGLEAKVAAARADLAKLDDFASLQSGGLLLPSSPKRSGCRLNV